MPGHLVMDDGFGHQLKSDGLCFLRPYLICLVFLSMFLISHAELRHIISLGFIL